MELGMFQTYYIIYHYIYIYMHMNSPTSLKRQRPCRVIPPLFSHLGAQRARGTRENVRLSSAAMPAASRGRFRSTLGP